MRERCESVGLFSFPIASSATSPSPYFRQGFQAADVRDERGAGEVFGEDLWGDGGKEGVAAAGEKVVARLAPGGRAFAFFSGPIPIPSLPLQFAHLLAAGVHLALQHNLVAGLGNGRREGQGERKKEEPAPPMPSARPPPRPRPDLISHSSSLSLSHTHTICRPRSMPPQPENREATRRRLPATMVVEWMVVCVVCVCRVWCRVI